MRLVLDTLLNAVRVTMKAWGFLMTVIELPDEQAPALKAKAAAAGLTLEAWLQKLAEQEPSASRRHQHIADVIVENMRNVPA